MQLISVRLLVRNFSASIRFWQDVMGLTMPFCDEGLTYAYFDTGSTLLELIGRDSMASAIDEATPTPDPVGQRAVISFRVENVDETYTRLIESGATAIKGPLDRATWNARAAHIADPDGHLIEIYSPLSVTNA
ncbi:VOC family protein [Ktedonospora formicarum]|uniref:Glyoxalase n=1 Tax=Ktedonospora formicarum TaxID=2778364 RepID=A0A8J3I3E9_9CHLR|nr:VOC family protein [Ktedonospora formicarum]GHO46861.1 glyoxalase [Ktedonospora formicarum]